MHHSHPFPKGRRSAVTVAVLAAFAAVVPIASAQSFKIEKLADGVYAAMASPEVRTNSGIIVNRDDVVVVDAPLRPSWGRDLVAEIRKITDKPVRMVINTHYHSDHVYGNQAFLEAYGPNVQFIAQSTMREDTVNLDLPALPQTGQTAPIAIARLKKNWRTAKIPPATRSTRERAPPSSCNLRCKPGCSPSTRRFIPCWRR